MERAHTASELALLVREMDAVLCWEAMRRPGDAEGQPWTSLQVNGCKGGVHCLLILVSLITVSNVGGMGGRCVWEGQLWTSLQVRGDGGSPLCYGVLFVIIDVINIVGGTGGAAVGPRTPAPPTPLPSLSHRCHQPLTYSNIQIPPHLRFLTSASRSQALSTWWRWTGAWWRPSPAGWGRPRWGIGT